MIYLWIILGLDETVEPLKGTLTYRMKDNAVKSEIDKNNELCRSAVRVVVTLAKLAEHGMLKELSKILIFISLLIIFFFCRWKHT